MCVVALTWPKVLRERLHNITVLQVGTGRREEVVTIMVCHLTAGVEGE